MTDKYKGKKLLIVDSGSQLIKESIISGIASLGIEIEMLVPYYAEWCTKYASFQIVCDFKDVQDVLKKVNSRHMLKSYDGILTVNEGSTTLANRIQHALNLPVISRNTSINLTDKIEVRKELGRLQINSPKYWEVECAVDLAQVDCFPVVVKPASLMGSNGVYFARNATELADGYKISNSADYSFSASGKVHSISSIYGVCDRAIVEEYIDGEEFSVEAMVSSGTFLPIGITKKKTINHPYFDEKGHFYESGIPCDKRKAIYSYVDEVVQALSLDCTFIHAEIRIRGGIIYLIEIASRIAGDFIPDLVQISTEANIPYLLSGLAFGERYDQEFSDWCLYRYSAVWFLSAAPEHYGKTLKQIEFDLEKLGDYNVHCSNAYYESGDVIPVPITWGDTRVGCIIISSDNPFDIENVMDKLEGSVRLTVE